MPLAAVLALTELIGHSNGKEGAENFLSRLTEIETASTMQQLLESLQKGAAVLKSRSSNPLSLTAGCDLFIRYVTSLPQDTTVRPRFLTNTPHTNPPFLAEEIIRGAQGRARSAGQEICTVDGSYVPRHDRTACFGRHKG
jgi:translation initiation factor eIF-2B subunit alpha